MTEAAELDLDECLADAQAKVEHYGARRNELKEEIASLDAQERELARGITMGMVEGFEVEAVKTQRREVREQLEDATRAFVELDGLEAGAAEDVSAFRQEMAAGRYVVARGAEAEATAKLERALMRLVPLLEGMHEAGKESYSLGLEAGLETSRHLQRRNFTTEGHLGTVLGTTYPSFMPRSRLRVEALGERLAELLPAIGTNGEGETGGNDEV